MVRNGKYVKKNGKMRWNCGKMLVIGEIDKSTIVFFSFVMFSDPPPPSKRKKKNTNIMEKLYTLVVSSNTIAALLWLEKWHTGI